VYIRGYYVLLLILFYKCYYNIIHQFYLDVLTLRTYNMILLPTPVLVHILLLFQRYFIQF